MAAIYRAFLGGTTTDSPLLIGATTYNSTNLSSMPVVAAPDYMWVALDPLGVNGAPEIVKVTLHTAAASSATIVRGQQTTFGGGAARAHPLGSTWAATQTPMDLVRPYMGGTVGTVTGATVVTVGAAESIVQTLVVPAQPVAGQLLISTHLRVDKSLGTDVFRINIKDSATVLAYTGVEAFATVTSTWNPNASLAVAAGVAKTINLALIRISGTGTASAYNDFNLTRLSIIFVPDL